MTPGELRSQLTETLQPWIGTYTFPNGRKHPAIAVIKGNEEYPQSGTIITGLECVIFYPEIKPVAVLESYLSKQVWRIHLKQWEKGKGLKKEQEAILASPLQAIVKNIVAIPAEERLGIPESAQIELLDFHSVG